MGRDKRDPPNGRMGRWDGERMGRSLGRAEAESCKNLSGNSAVKYGIICAMKRIVIFTLVNLAVMVMLSISCEVIFALCGVQAQEVFGDYAYLAIFSLVFGFGGAFISLLMSKPMAKWSTGARTITGNEGEAERWLVDTIGMLARQANVKMPEVAIYKGAANAFATGAFKNSALIAVSTDIMRQMTRDELRAVLGHEMSHVVNGDMVTMCLAQGVMNTFVLFVSRVAAWMVSQSLNNRGDERGSSRRSGGFTYYMLIRVFEILLGLLAAIITCWYSRKREFAADAGSAKLLGSPYPMIAALQRLGNLQPGVLPDSIKAFGIASAKRKESLFATHPALERRIEALQQYSVH